MVYRAGFVLDYRMPARDNSSPMLSSSLMYRVARNPAAGARGPAGAVRVLWLGVLYWKLVFVLLIGLGTV